MEALLEAARMDTRGREDPGPDFLSGIDDFAVDENMAKLMREVYVAFPSEVSGAECKADAGKLMDLILNLMLKRRVI